jgi:hypothetical protein
MLVQGRKLPWCPAVASANVRCGGMVQVMQGTQVEATPNEKIFRCRRREKFSSEWDCRTKYATLIAVQGLLTFAAPPTFNRIAAPWTAKRRAFFFRICYP